MSLNSVFVSRCLRRAIRAALILGLVSLGEGAAMAQTPSAATTPPMMPVPPATIVRDGQGQATVRSMPLPAPLTFDGRLDEAVYRDVPSSGDFIQQDPIEGGPPTDKTEVWVFYDDDYLYVSARLWELHPERRVANEMRRDSFNLYNNDHFAVSLDTFNDRRNGYGFYVNALGGMGDSQVINEQPNPNWNTLWDARTADFDGGWTVEFQIPFRSIRFKEGGDTWGINFRRLVRWNNESTFLTAVPRSWGRRGLAKISSAGTLVGLATPAKQRNVDVKPYGLGSLLTNRLATPPLDNDLNGEFGADAKWAITQSVVADRKTIAWLKAGGSPATAKVAVGEGQIQWAEVLNAAHKIGVKHYFLEDETVMPLKSIPESFKYLRALKL